MRNKTHPLPPLLGREGELTATITSTLPLLLFPIRRGGKQGRVGDEFCCKNDYTDKLIPPLFSREGVGGEFVFTIAIFLKLEFLICDFFGANKMAAPVCGGNS